MGKFGIFVLSLVPAAVQLAVFFVPRSVAMLGAGDPPPRSTWAEIGIFAAWVLLGIGLVAKAINLVQLLLMMLYGWALEKCGVAADDVEAIQNKEAALDISLSFLWPCVFVTGWLAWKLWF